jgi:transporter family protein
LPLATLFAIKRDRGFHPPHGAWRHGATAAVLLLFGLVMLLAGLARGEASVLVPVAQMSFVVTAGLGFIFLREALTIRKGLGLAFAIVALTCLARS